MIVTSLDWAPKTNRIASCSQDKNAYVWNYDASSSTWKPTLVHLRLERAATFVRWSHNEEKFAVASGARSIAVCYFGEDNDWWVSKHLKKPIASTVLSLCWHPNDVLIACGGTDMKARVFSGFIKGVDSKPAPTVWGERLPFGTICGEYESEFCGWVHDVSFSPDGNQLAFVSHDSTLTIIDPLNNSATSVLSKDLPYKRILWMDYDKIVVSGQDSTPSIYTLGGNGWELSSVFKKPKAGVRASSPAPDSPLMRSSAFNMFKSMDSRSSSGHSNEDESSASVVDQSPITDLRFLVTEGNSRFSTSSLGGKVKVYDILTNQA
ncbi:Actin-related protein 2/3 complex subunit 1 [Smittium culicis]|uniref:Arp2/3 complex 41 kDa subunit n=1 Tax=Smittium culicis TaxID=133412 RepID=A0A1R1YG94_9FUNG|nr:Actin-related protein 2/3 complex subunit 1 [Smittium culicis]